MHRLLALALLALAPAAAASNCTRTSVGLTPLTDLRDGSYQGSRGGLYPGGRNTPSPAYLKKGLAYAAQVRPRGPDGAPSASGKVVLLSIGMSNATVEFSAFEREAAADPAKSAQLALVDGAEGGQDAERIKDPASPYWSFVDSRLAGEGVTRAQVQAVWLKEAIAGENEPFPADARRLQGDIEAIVGILRGRFPNLRLVYLSSRIYAGYATSALNPEPAAYDSGFAVKWTVIDRIEGKLTGPWVGWGPYLWADGLSPRGDRLTWSCPDFRDDGTHPSPGSGVQKVAGQLLSFFKASRTARPWFLSR